MALHVKLIEDLEARLKAHVVGPLEARIAALEERLEEALGGKTTPAQEPAQAAPRGRRAKPAETQATVHDVVVEATAPAAGDAPKAG
jgi:hypothetical protein